MARKHAAKSKDRRSSNWVEGGRGREKTIDDDAFSKIGEEEDTTFQWSDSLVGGTQRSLQRPSRRRPGFKLLFKVDGVPNNWIYWRIGTS